MIDEATLVKWEGWMQQDDCWKYVSEPSDLKEMLKEIRRLQGEVEVLQGVLKREEREIWITPDGQIHKL